MSGSLKEELAVLKKSCPHNALRKKRGAYEFNAYVCGNCSTIFEVEEYVEPLPEKPELIVNKIPWGLRGRQA